MSEGFIPGSKDSFYIDQARDVVLLDSIPFNVYKFTFGPAKGLPNWMANKLNRILSLNEVEINEEQYVKNDGAKFEPIRDKNYPLAGWQIEMVKVEKDDSLIDEEEEAVLGLELTFDNIINAPVANVSSVSDWNTFFDLPTNGTPFTSVEVIGNMVRFIGGSGITVKDMLFFENLNLLSVLKGIEIVSVGIAGFGYCDNLTEISLLGITNAEQTAFAINTSLEILNFPLLTTAGDGCFSANQLVNTINFPLLETAGNTCFNGLSVNNIFSFPSLLSCGDNCFAGCIAATKFYLPLCTSLGTTTGNNEVFLGITGKTITLTIPAALMTCNGGSPDADIQYLQENNTVTIVTV